MHLLFVCIEVIDKGVGRVPLQHCFELRWGYAVSYGLNSNSQAS